MKIAIVGAGPRGLSAAERVIEWARKTEINIQLTLFDPYGPGGKIWRAEQPNYLLMNTVISQVTLFTDESFSGEGPIVKGPTLYEWTQTEAAQYIQQQQPYNYLELLKECHRLGPNDHCSRAFYGMYQKWFYTYLATRCNEQTSLTFFKEPVTAVRAGEDNYYVYTQSIEFTADKVILAMGHQENELTTVEQELADYAKEHRLFYSSPKNAADALLALANIPAKQPVVLKGLGLAFFDYLSALTLGRGGVFSRQNGRLRYEPSGREPIIIAGSGRGFPSHPRGNNQKGYGETYQPVFLTETYLAECRKKGQVTGAEFFGYLKKEVEYVYYTCLIEEKYPHLSKEAFQQLFIQTKGAPKSLAHFEKQDWFDWQVLEHPETKKTTHERFRSFLLEYLKWDIQEAEKGNLSGPLTTALDSLKDLRDQIRFVLDEGLLTNDESQKWLWHWFTPLNTFLSVGPSVERTEELQALVELGLVTILGPEMRVEMKAGQFITYANLFPENRYNSHFLIEARIPKVNNEKSLNPLTRQLLADKLATLHQLALADGQIVKTGALLIVPATNQVITKDGQVATGLFSCGIPTEGIHWLTAAAARPGVDPWNMRDMDRIAATIFNS
ncbi:FAD/NAD(P)-binding protein [Enterococcus faecalis]|uniref:FAD/NAD(P)-binding protein n=1 Tax=Enterococcus faecalis TaxID=1351 RepID=UPI0006666392|nr:FAD/NAD(P)-binding protein [Enterococcus faecalis]